MSQTLGQNFQDVQESALPVLGLPARTNNEAIFAAIDQNSNTPLRLYASSPASAVLNIAAQEVKLSNGTGKSVPPISGQIPTVPASTINFQTGGTTGATFNLSFPASTLGYFRRLGLSLLSNGEITGIFSDEVADAGDLADPGSLFVPSTIPMGWLDLECTNISGLYKTIGSATNIIENSVSGVSRIHAFGSGGGGGGGGTAGELLLDPVEISNFLYYTRSDFSREGNTLIDSITGATDSITVASKVVFTDNGQILTTLNLAGPQVIEDAIPTRVVQARLLYTVGKVDNPTVEFSRDGGSNYFAATTEVLTSEGNVILAYLTFADSDPVATDLRIRITSGTNSEAVGGTELLGFGVDFTLDVPLSLTALSLIYDAIVGSFAQVASGLAQYNSIGAALTAFPTGKILVLKGTYTENLTINSNVHIEGQGYASILNGTLTFGSSADYCSFRMMKITDNITFNSGADGIFLRECWQATGKTVVDNGSANSILVIQE